MLRQLIGDRGISRNISEKYMTNMYCLDTMRQVSLAITTLAKEKLLLHEMDEGQRYAAYILSNKRG
jgi:hypothetical protein